MKVGIYGQFYHKNSDKHIQNVLETLCRLAEEVYVETHFFSILQSNLSAITKKFTFKTFSELDSSFDLFFTIGGDGTLLRGVTFVGHLGIPIVGINTGRLGFLATLQKEHLKESLSEIIKGHYLISNRSLLSVTTSDGKMPFGNLNFALNEVAVNRKNTTSMILVHTEVDGEHLNSYWSDGLIVATPTGSTGYSLSCGGPVLAPTTNGIVLTPIAPHNLNARPLVIPDTATISLQVSGRENTYLASLDSRVCTLNEDTLITIKKADFQIKLVQQPSSSFLKTIRQKLLWGEDRRN